VREYRIEIHREIVVRVNTYGTWDENVILNLALQNDPAVRSDHTTKKVTRITPEAEPPVT
jgi:hypothetical protein